MNVQLFNPPNFYYSGLYYRMMPPLGLPIISTMLEKAGHHVEIADLEALQVTPDMLKEAFTKQAGSWPDVIGFTSLTVSARGTKECIKALRAAGFNNRIIVGGSHPSLAPEEAATWGADLVVTGECEGNVVELFEGQQCGIVAGKQVPIEDVPIPSWNNHSPKVNSYWGNTALVRPNPGITMWTRGCPFSCIFCANLIFKGQATRYRPPVNIEAELKDLKRHGCKKLYVYDDELVGSRMPEGWMKEVADRIEPLGFEWVTQGRCSKRFVTPELMADVKRAGCRTIFWGIESFSEKVLKSVKKRATTEDFWHTLRVSRAAGIENGVFTMIGNYQETEEDLAITRDALAKGYKEGIIQYRQTTYCDAMEGTEYAEIQRREGWYHKWTEDDKQQMNNFHGTPTLPADRFEYWMNEFRLACPVGIPV